MLVGLPQDGHIANEKCKSYLNHVSPNNKSVLYNLSSSSVILCMLRKGGH